MGRKGVCGRQKLIEFDSQHSPMCVGFKLVYLMDTEFKILESKGLVIDVTRTTGMAGERKSAEVWMDEYEEALMQSMNAKPTKACAICKKGRCKQRCSSCLVVYYCGRAHQKEDWKEHKKYCDNIKVLVPVLAAALTEQIGSIEYTNEHKITVDGRWTSIPNEVLSNAVYEKSKGRFWMEADMLTPRPTSNLPPPGIMAPSSKRGVGGVCLVGCD